MKTLIVAVLLFFSVNAFTQATTLIVEGTTPDLYLTHTVAPKESYYSLARMYNIPPALLASFNKSNLQTGLRIGQNIKVPLTTQNFAQNNQSDPSETLLPLYHVVAKSETLFRIGANHNKVALASIKDWNKLASENIAAGTPLVVGFLRVKNDQAGSFGGAVPASATTSAAPATTPTPKPAFSPEPVNETANTAAQTTAVVKPTPAETKALENVPARTSQPANTVAENPAPIQEVTKTSEPVKSSAETTDLLAPVPAGIPEEGFFASTFAAEAGEKQRTENAGEAGTFKSVSGWQNKKYYVLMNGVEPGTIVKITAADKSVYAKVLGSLPEVKDDKNLLLRLSNSAASYLGKVDPKFQVQVEYYR